MICTPGNDVPAPLGCAHTWNSDDTWQYISELQGLAPALDARHPAEAALQLSLAAAF